MTLKQIVDIPADRRIFLDLPSVPAGRARIEVTITPEKDAAGIMPRSQDNPWLRGWSRASGDTMEAYFERHHAENAWELAREKQREEDGRV